MFVPEFPQFFHLIRNFSPVFSVKLSEVINSTGEKLENRVFKLSAKGMVTYMKRLLVCILALSLLLAGCGSGSAKPNDSADKITNISAPSENTGAVITNTTTPKDTGSTNTTDSTEPADSAETSGSTAPSDSTAPTVPETDAPDTTAQTNPPSGDTTAADSDAELTASSSEDATSADTKAPETDAPDSEAPESAPADSDTSAPDGSEGEVTLTLDQLRARMISDDIVFSRENEEIAEQLAYYLGQLGYAEIGAPKLDYWLNNDRISDGLELRYSIWSVMLDGVETSVSAVTVISDKYQRLSDIFYTDSTTDSGHIRIDLLAEIANSDPRFEERFDASEPQSADGVEVINISKLGSALLEEKYPDAPLWLYNSFIDSDGLLKCVYYSLGDYGWKPLCTLMIDLDRGEAVGLSEPVDSPASYGFAPSELDSPDGRFTALSGEDSDLCIRDNETGEVTVVYEACIVDDPQTFRNPIIWKFIDGKLYYNVYGWEFYAGLGVYDCETGENQIYHVHCPLTVIDGVIYTETWYNEPFTIYSLSFEGGEAVETPLLGGFETDEMICCVVDPETRLIAMLSSSLSETNKPYVLFYLYSVDGEGLSPVMSARLDSRLCCPQNAQFCGDRLMIFCGSVTGCDNYVYLVNLSGLGKEK